MYHEDLPAVSINEASYIQEEATNMAQHVLCLADPYGMDRLKLMCARKLWDNVTVHTVVSILLCAETYGCPELKNKCLDFCTAGKISRR